MHVTLDVIHGAPGLGLAAAALIERRHALALMLVAVASAMVAGVAFLVYVITAYPSVPPGDSGELIAAAWSGGVPPNVRWKLSGNLASLAAFQSGS